METVVARQPGAGYFESGGIALTRFMATAEEVALVLDREGVVQDAMPNLPLRLGYQVQELLGKSIDLLVHPEDLHILRAFQNKLENSVQEQRNVKLRFMHGSGDFRHCLLYLDVLEKDRSESGLRLLMIRDITQLVAARRALKNSEERLELASEAAGYALWELDVKEDKLLTSGKLFEGLGYPMEGEPASMSGLIALINPEDVLRYKRRLDRHLKGSSPTFIAEYRLLAEDGSYVWFMTSGRVVEWDQHEGARRMVGVSRDITERKWAEEHLLTSAENLRSILEASPVGVAVTRNDGAIIFCNRRLAEMGNKPKELLMGLNARSFFVEENRFDELYQAFEAKGAIYGQEVELRFSPGSTIWAQTTWVPMDFQGEPSILTWIYDITELKRVEEQLRELATVDGLTGAFNRRYFMVRAQRELERSRRYDKHMALLMLDADHFKEVNDAYGHDVGDEVLKLLVQTIRTCLRSVDVLGRLGGEEFAVILPETGLVGALVVAERLRVRVEQAVLKTESGPVRFTVSLGVATTEAEAPDVETMLKGADKGLYVAKNSGRNRVAVDPRLARDGERG